MKKILIVVLLLFAVSLCCENKFAEAGVFIPPGTILSYYYQVDIVDSLDFNATVISFGKGGEEIVILSYNDMLKMNQKELRDLATLLILVERVCITGWDRRSITESEIMFDYLCKKLLPEWIIRKSK